MFLSYPVIDLHTHLRNDITKHTKIAKESGIDTVCYMANCEPVLDTLESIQQSLKEKRYCNALPVSAITENLEGKKLVDVEAIKDYVVGFSDDGRYLENLDLLAEILNRGVDVTCETCPHYFTYTKNDLDVKVNPPLAEKDDVLAIKKGLVDATIDIIASDYAPEPRETGIADFKNFIPLCHSLVLEKMFSEQQLKEKLFLNPKKIIKNGRDVITSSV